MTMDDEQNRDASTGRYVTDEYAAAHPDTTVAEQPSVAFHTVTRAQVADAAVAERITGDITMDQTVRLLARLGVRVAD